MVAASLLAAVIRLPANPRSRVASARHRVSRKVDTHPSSLPSKGTVNLRSSRADSVVLLPVRVRHLAHPAVDSEARLLVNPASAVLLPALRRAHLLLDSVDPHNRKVASVDPHNRRVDSAVLLPAAPVVLLRASLDLAANRLALAGSQAWHRRSRRPQAVASAA